MVRYRPHARTVRDDTGRILMTRQAVAHLAHRHPSYVRAVVPPVACDVATRAMLLDLDQAEELLGSLGRRDRDPSNLQPIEDDWTG